MKSFLPKIRVCALVCTLIGVKLCPPQLNSTQLPEFSYNYVPFFPSLHLVPFFPMPFFQSAIFSCAFFIGGFLRVLRFPPPEKLISSFHRLDMTLAVAEALNPNKPYILISCSRSEDGPSCRHGVKPPLTHSLFKPCLLLGLV